jgi:hypothetical protein
MEMTERQMERAALQYAAANSEPVSTLTHSVPYVAKHFLAWRENKMKVASASQSGGAPKVSTRKTPSNVIIPRIRATVSSGNLRARAFAAFAVGTLSVKEVSAMLNISYANAHYYKRAYNKQSA